MGRPSHKPVVWYKSFRYQAASWKTARRVVAKVEHHQGELFREGGLHRDQSDPAEPGGGAVYQARHRRAMDQAGKQAVKMTRLSCAIPIQRGAAVAERDACNLGNLWRRLVLPQRIDHWSLTSVQQRLVKTGGRLVKHARYYRLMLAESHLTRRLFGSMVQRITRRCRCQRGSRSRGNKYIGQKGGKGWRRV